MHPSRSHGVGLSNSQWYAAHRDRCPHHNELDQIAYLRRFVLYVSPPIMSWWDERFAIRFPASDDRAADTSKSKGGKKPKENRQQKATVILQSDPSDPLHERYGDRKLIQSTEQASKAGSKVADITGEMDGENIYLRARIHTVRGKGKSCFLVLRQQTATIQCILFADDVHVSKTMVKYAMGISKESIVDIEAVAKKTEFEILACTQKDVELQVTSVHCLSRAEELPFELTAAARSDAEIEEAKKTGEQLTRVQQGTRLDNRFLDLRTPANQAIFRVQSHVCRLFRNSLLQQGFVEIHSPKLVAGTSEGGSAVFQLNYMGQPACLAQSPQLYKQMAICADFGRVFEIGPVFRAENSDTHRHLCEFTGLDFEMAIQEHYFEVLDVLETVFESICDGLANSAASELLTVQQQYPFTPFRFKRVRLSFEEGIELLQNAGHEDVGPMDDLNTMLERALGKIVAEKYDSDFYILYRYPLCIRPFYTMPCADDNRYSNSYDVFMRGEEIISGAQRIHDPDLLIQRAKAHEIPVEQLASYINSFRLGAPPHGGVGVGLERVVMLYLGLDNVRKTSLFPRDLRRLMP